MEPPVAAPAPAPAGEKGYIDAERPGGGARLGARRRSRAIIAAGNAIAAKPYKYGGGHGRWNDTGYDCSGSVSYVAARGRPARHALDSTGFMSWARPGAASGSRSAPTRATPT